ncbi:hypothetical protein GLOTRDRAFT_133877 [Gloeophyllum trabeum ATCC 11539]|uniref:Protein kinase domain-containing protein n=1 Tax=Gloeophyllum trabeum (strain ATCC 11539 / FP-39264 / Madison 617) TaxID=670483 RepID=S7RDL3_GLOTA|nr:uncharacterized protein GLOTRDRAFT_133877 [Gloeophyllum trabeum ATCC 11539]EPQ50504.1 hypothetical protein GLOTRDRAFT_133877 [Gloeophyllum trabeum ATCC 11539]
MELLKKIERSKGIKCPDEDPSKQSDELKPVSPDVKQLIRRLLTREPIERCSFEEFFGSTALAKSRFPRPSKTRSTSSEEPAQPASTAEAEVLDPKVVLPPSKLNFKRQENNDGQR